MTIIMSKKAILSLRSLTLIILLLVSSTSAWAESLTVNPLSQNVLLGDLISVDINISDATDLYGWQFSLGYDDTILSLLSVTSGSFLDTAGSTFWWAPDTSTSGEILNGSELLLGDISGADGSGTLMTLNFDTIGAGTSFIDIYTNDGDPGNPTEMLNSFGNSIDFSTTDGSVTVAIVPEPISSTLFIIGGVALGYRGFRKRIKT